MIGIILVTHGQLADEFLSALEHIVGDQKNIGAICIQAEDDMEKRRAEIFKAVRNLDDGDGVIFDQTTVTAFPGSSGGGVFLTERGGDDAGKYVGMLVRGAGETFNFIVPVRRMRKWAKKQNVLWALDEKESTPSYEDILKLPIEGSSDGSPAKGEKKSLTEDSKTFPILIQFKKDTKVPFIGPELTR